MSERIHLHMTVAALLSALPTVWMKLTFVLGTAACGLGLVEGDPACII